MTIHPCIRASVIGATALLAACPASDRAGGGRNARVAAQESVNWSGYVVDGGPGAFNAAAGSWDVPAVACGGEDTASATWVGIGGGTPEDPTLIQAGTFQDCFDGVAEYRAWWEAIPAPAVEPGGFLDGGDYPVAPGDHLEVSVDGGNFVAWTIVIRNTTRGWTFTTDAPYTSAGATAEWIEEAPVSAGTGGAGFTTLADYGSVRFTGITANGENPRLRPEHAMAMVDEDGNVISNPSPPDDSGDAFTVCYGPEACD